MTSGIVWVKYFKCIQRSLKFKTPSGHLVYLEVFIFCNEGINVGALAKHPAKLPICRVLQKF
jgi:hypothetical protein